ncbi:MAG TPA: hypothetical protein VE338_21675 [Ktedonobacterales bacterium]|nr:hypothetical protein [Ktedonobacterales bacterium]
MTHDSFDVYATIIKDTNEMNARRRQLDSLYVTLITLILTADAYVAFYSSFTNWLLVFATIGISIVGGAVTTRWRDGLHNLDEILNFRYTFLRDLEASDEMKAIGATLYSQEWNHIYGPRQDKRFRSVTNRLQLTFIIVFVLIPLVLLGLTVAETIPVVHALIPSQVIPFIAPLAPLQKP